MPAHHLLEELPLGDELAGMANEDLEQVPFGGREADLAGMNGRPIRRMGG
jgi:hypothetical protein